MSSAARIVRLVEKRPDGRIIEQLRTLLMEAEQGKLIGFLAVGHYGGREYSYFGSGSFCDHPTIGLGALTILKARIG